ncbi:hypothetical protein PG984_013946 [Apiospora sp. TS-2023a]
MKCTFLYKHKPLRSEDSIRVFDLLPARLSIFPVKVELMEISLSDIEVEYEALSYVWGEANKGKYIICGGKRLPVTDNCHDALVRLRRKHQPRRLWVDSICIDQSASDASMTERNHQVQRMGQVYNRAIRVIVWLATKGTELEALFEFLSEWERQPDLKTWNWCAHPSASFLKRLKLKLFTGMSTHSVSPSTLGRKKPHVKIHLLTGLNFYFSLDDRDTYFQIHDGIDHFDMNPWFHRVWTVQEVTLARAATIIMNRSELRWEILAAGLLADNGISTGGLAERTSLIDLVKLRRSLGSPVHTGMEPPTTGLVGIAGNANFEDHCSILRCLAYLNCSLPHDKVFGLHAVLTAWGYSLLPPDYGRSVSEVLQELVIAFIQLHRSLLPLVITLPPEPWTGLPSWIPDWSASRQPSALPVSRSDDMTGTFSALRKIRIFINGKDLEPYQAKNRNANTAVWDSSLGSLQVRGKRVGKVLSLIGPGYDVDSFLKVCRRWCQMLDVSAINMFITMSLDAIDGTVRFSYPSPANYFALGKPSTLACGDAFLGWFHTMRYPDAYLAEAALRPSSLPWRVVEPNYLRIAKERRQTHPLFEHVKKPDEVWFKSSVFDYAQYTFITLDSGLYARAHRTCHVGDEAWLLAGSDVPVMLRRQEDDQFRVVAPAYIHGIMLGEMWPEDTSTLETITLV